MRRLALVVAVTGLALGSSAAASSSSEELEAMLARSRSRRAELGGEVGRRRARRQRRTMNRRTRERYRVHSVRARATEVRVREHERELVAPSPTRAAPASLDPALVATVFAEEATSRRPRPPPAARSAAVRPADCPPCRVGPNPQVVEVPAPGLPIAPTVERARAALAAARRESHAEPTPRPGPTRRLAPPMQPAPRPPEKPPALPRMVGPDPQVTGGPPVAGSPWTEDLDQLLAPARGVGDVDYGRIASKARKHGVDDIHVLHDLMVRDALRKGADYPGLVPRRALSD